MPPRAKRQYKTVSSGSAVQNKNSVTASEKSGAADLPSGEKRAAAAKSRQKSRETASTKAGKASAGEKNAAKARETASAKAGKASAGEKNAAKSRETASAKAGKASAGEKNAAKSRKADSVDGQDFAKTDENAVSCKTPQVMKLISDDSAGNPVIVAGKSRIPTRLRGREPLSRVLKRQLHGEPLEPDEADVVNLTEIAVKYEAPLILDRFNACSCEKCVKNFSEIMLKKVPVRFARVTKSSPEACARDLNSRVEPVRKMVQVAMIRELIGSKKRLFHDE